MVIWPWAEAKPKVLRLRENSGVTANALSAADRVTAATPLFCEVEMALDVPVSPEPKLVPEVRVLS